jgi:hypothetical protein
MARSTVIRTTQQPQEATCSVLGKNQFWRGEAVIVHYADTIGAEEAPARPVTWRIRLQHRRKTHDARRHPLNGWLGRQPRR